MPTLPNYILDVLGQNKTSLGKHPSFPPDKDDNFITNLVQHTFDELRDKIDDIDYPTLKNELSKLLSKCLIFFAEFVNSIISAETVLSPRAVAQFRTFLFYLRVR